MTLSACCMPLCVEAQHAAPLEVVSSTTQGRPAGSLVPAPAVSFTAESTNPFTLIAYAQGLDGNAIPSATICVGTDREVGAFRVKAADTNGRAIFTLPIASQYSVTAAKAGYAEKTVLFAPAGTAGNITIKLATGLIGATCTAAR